MVIVQGSWLPLSYDLSSLTSIHCSKDYRFKETEKIGRGNLFMAWQVVNINWINTEVVRASVVSILQFYLGFSIFFPSVFYWWLYYGIRMPEMYFKYSKGKGPCRNSAPPKPVIRLEPIIGYTSHPTNEQRNPRALSSCVSPRVWLRLGMENALQRILVVKQQELKIKSSEFCWAL